MKYNAFSSRLVTLEAGKPNSYGCEYMSLAQSFYVAKRISEVFEPALSESERKLQVREIALILSPETALFDETCYLDPWTDDTSEGSGGVEPSLRYFISLKPQQVNLVVELGMWYGQYNIFTIDAKHVFCVSDLSSGRCIVFQRLRYKGVVEVS